MGTNFNAQTLAIFVLMSIVMFAFIGVLGFIVYKKIKETDPTQADTSIDPNIQTAQEFLQFQDIKDGVIDLGNHRYRAVIECSSVNYNLKTPTEKEMIEVGYEQFINSIKFPITMFIQTRVIDSTYISKTLEKDMEIVRKKFSNLEDYMDLYLDSMKNLKHYLPNTKHKKKYVIIPYEDSYLMPELTDAEKYDYSLNELRNRADIVKRGLEGVGINCKILDTRDAVEMVYAAYHKEHFSPDKIDAMVDGDFFSLLTSGENRYSKLSSAMKVDLILNEAQNKLRKDVLMSDGIPKEIKKKYKELYDEIDVLRDSVGGHYKEGKMKVNLYEDNIQRYNMDNIKNNGGLRDIEEDDVNVSVKESIPLQQPIPRLNNKKIQIPSYEQDPYIDNGFLDKYDRRSMANEEYPKDNGPIEHERSFIPQYQEPIKKENKNKSNKIEKSSFSNTNTSKKVRTQGYYDENISNNNIPNFEVSLGGLNKSNKNNNNIELDMFNDDDDSGDTPNSRTRDLSFFK